MVKQIISMRTVVKKSIQEVYDEFIFSCKVRNFSEFTIYHYEKQMQLFKDYCNFNQPVTILTKQLFDDYVLFCKSKDISEITVQTYTKVIRTFYYFCMDRNYIPQFKVHLSKATKPLKETYTDEELMVLLKKPDVNKCKFAEYRTWVMINYVLATGNRMNTIANLKIQDIDLYNQVIKLTATKNKKQQIIPMSSTLKEVLEEYLTYRQGNPENYLFCTQTGEQCHKTCITQSLINYNHSRGVTKTSLHLFRHTFAKKYLMNGGDVFRLQKLMGHSDISVTKEYLNLVIDDLQDNYDKFNPLEQLTVQENNFISLKKKR